MARAGEETRRLGSRAPILAHHSTHHSASCLLWSAPQSGLSLRPSPSEAYTALKGIGDWEKGSGHPNL